MIYLKQKLFFLGIIFFVMGGFAGCGEPKPAPEEYLIKTAQLTISSEEFFEELDLKKAAYPYNIKTNPAEYNEMVIHLVKALSEEIILLSVAAEKGVTVSDQEVEIAEKEMKKDYPGESFDQMLLKNAISYDFWKKRFKKNMIMDKLIELELENKIEITSQDIIDFYKTIKKEAATKPGDVTSALTLIENENELVSRLRMKKTQESYGEWIQELWKTYPVEIDKEKLKTFLIDIESDKGIEDAQ